MNHHRIAPTLLASIVLAVTGPAVPVAAQTGGSAETDSPLGTAKAIPTIAWQQAGDFLEREVFLVGKIVRTGQSRTGHVFLNFDRDFRNTPTLFIYSDNVKRFPRPPAKLYQGKMVKVRGFLYQHGGAPNLSITSPERIEILPDDSPLPLVNKPSDVGRRVIGDPVTIGLFNVLNLFDNADDPYRGDEITPPKPIKGLQALAQAIRELNADVLALCEVENRGALQQFVHAYLSDEDYEVVLFEGNDVRGIDVAVLSRLPVGPVTSHRHLRLPTADGGTTQFQRDLLQVRIEPPGAKAFDVFVVHFKSKGGEEDGADIRLAEAQATRRVLDDLLGRDPQAEFVICGDFNDTIDSEPLKAVIGTGSGALRTFVDDLPSDRRITYNQPPHLSMIDFILASPSMARRYVPKTYAIVPGSPDTTGSDHNAVVAKFKIK
ncbi:MAG: hypothetical protein AMXMBFR13_26060 [Phycisphaerae bacterium]